MNKRINQIILAMIIISVTACSTPKARINYNDFRDSGIALKAGSWGGADMGRLAGEAGGAVWDSCTEKARGSVEELITLAKSVGANAIGDIRWSASGSSEPRCKKGWGYTMLPVFLLTPLFMSTRVEGTAYKVKSLGKNMMYLPRTVKEKETFISTILNK